MRFPDRFADSAHAMSFFQIVRRSDALNTDNSKRYVARSNSADWHFECKRVGGICALLNDANDASLIFVTASITLHHMYIVALELENVLL